MRAIRMRASILEQLRRGPVLGDGGYLLELERRGYVDSGSEREKVGTGRGSGQFTPEVAIEHPQALRGLHEEFLVAGSVSRTQLLEREGTGAMAHARDLLQEQIRLLKDAGVDFLILETFFRL